MPIVPSRFCPPYLLSNGHVQTILGSLISRPAAGFSRERLELPDGDFLDLDWQRKGHSRLAILSHGLEGNSSAGYIRGTAKAMNKAGWDVLAWNMRSCSEEANRLPRYYHSGESGDLQHVIEHAAGQYPAISLIGFSLGGSVTLKYLGEAPPHPAVMRAACVSVPVNLRATAEVLDQCWQNRIYQRRFLVPMLARVASKSRQFPGRIDISGLDQVRTLHQFDERFTAPLHGFAGADDYYAKCSARQFLHGITVPALLLNACNDPFLTSQSMPFDEAAENPFFLFEAPPSGGHVGFIEALHGVPWFEHRVVAFLNGQGG